MTDANESKPFLRKLADRVQDHGRERVVGADPTSQYEYRLDLDDCDVLELIRLGLLGEDYRGEFFFDARPCTVFFRVRPTFKEDGILVMLVAL